MNIDIIGSGIGGLTAAIALQQKGIETRIFEQAPEIKPVGAGIILANNAMQVYEKLGLRKEIESMGSSVSSMNITDAHLRPLSKMNFKYFEDKYKVGSIAIHRGKLQQILLNQLNPNSIKLDHQLIGIAKSDSEYLLRFQGGETATSNLLLGADGLHSKVRNHLFPESTIRYASQICWRGVTNFALPSTYQNELNEAWGKGDRFGFVQIDENSVYWYALKSLGQHSKNFSINHLDEYFSSYHSVIQQIIKSTSLDSIHTATISDLSPINTWFKDSICLIGDAAHAATPNMGQGACQAIEDAYILSECLHKFAPSQAFSTFQQLRRPKAHQVVQTSWRLGKIAHWTNPIARTLRNQLLKMTPRSISQKQSDSIFQLQTV